MTKAEMIAHINSIPLDLLNNSVKRIIGSNPINEISQNRTYYREYNGQIAEIKFAPRATMENIMNVYHAILDQIIIHYGLETAHEIDWGYTPEWARETETAQEEEATEKETNPAQKKNRRNHGRNQKRNDRNRKNVRKMPP